MRPDLLYGVLERHAPIFKIEGCHFLVVENPASCFGWRVKRCDQIIRVKSLQVIDDPVC